MEEWRDIKGHQGYQVSSLGRVRSFMSRGRRGSGKRWVIGSRPQRILSPASNKGGYLQVNLGKNCPGRIHQLVAHAFLGDKPEELEVCHNNGNNQDNRVSNLRYDSHKANIGEASKQGRMASKYRHFSKKQAKDIRRRAKGGASYRGMAAEYGCSANTIRQICRGLTYKFAGGPISKKREPRRNLTPEQVYAIIRQCKAGTSQAQTAREYDTSESMVSRIVNGKSYRHLIK